MPVHANNKNKKINRFNNFGHAIGKVFGKAVMDEFQNGNKIYMMANLNYFVGDKFDAVNRFKTAKFRKDDAELLPNGNLLYIGCLDKVLRPEDIVEFLNKYCKQAIGKELKAEDVYDLGVRSWSGPGDATHKREKMVHFYVWPLKADSTGEVAEAISQADMEKKLQDECKKSLMGLYESIDKLDECCCCCQRRGLSIQDIAYALGCLLDCVDNRENAGIVKFESSGDAVKACQSLDKIAEALRSVAAADEEANVGKEIEESVKRWAGYAENGILID